METLYEAVGGFDAILALTRRWHALCLADPAAAHPFEHQLHPQHDERLAAYLAEALGGPGAVRSPRRPLHRVNPQVSVGLSDLVHKCLRRDPRDRYPDAAALATDLRRHLNHMPLLGVPNRSLVERWHKWRRRQPSALPRKVILLAAIVLAFAATAVLSGIYRRRVHDIEAAMNPVSPGLKCFERDDLRFDVCLPQVCQLVSRFLVFVFIPRVHAKECN